MSPKTKQGKKTSKKNSGPILVSILMGSASDWDTMLHCRQVLEDLEIRHEMRILSAHRTPEALNKYLKSSLAQGTQIYIAAAGMAAHLAGVVAAHTIKPVIGVPLAGPHLDGLDALLSTVQMPGGMPVATVAVGKAGAKNAAILAAQMLGLQDGKIAVRLAEMRSKAAREILLKDRQTVRKERPG
jgi:5-(carboxyamino)imidazole ribonucleotide mutase